jgi:hypothetical protein
VLPGRRPGDVSMDENWDTMLVSLASERVRGLLEAAVGTLEQITSPTEAQLDRLLRDLRSALAQLDVR